MIRKAVLSSIGLASLVALAAACGGAQQGAEGATAPATADSAKPADATAGAPGQAADATKKEADAGKKEAEPPKKEEPKQAGPAVLVKDVGFASPESVLYEAADDVYLVSNLNGAPGAVDNNGFISKVSPEGKVIELKWIAGGAKNVKLDAPKGMAIAGDTLYVADITTVRMFELKTGKPKGEVKLAGATFVNDLSSSADGKVYASDTGIKMGDKGPEPTKTESIWVIEKGKAKQLAKGQELGGPNGVLAAKDGVWAVTLMSGELYRVDDKGKRQDVTKMPKGQLDGIVAVGDGVLVSSWEASAIFRGKPGGTFEAVISDVKSPADIGYDSKRNRVLVPQLLENTLAAYDLK